MDFVKGEIRPGRSRKLSGAPEKIRAKSAEIYAHLPAMAQTQKTRCSVRRYDLEIPIGRSANFFCVTFLTGSRRALSGGVGDS